MRVMKSRNWQSSLALKGTQMQFDRLERDATFWTTSNTPNWSENNTSVYGRINTICHVTMLPLTLSIAQFNVTRAPWRPLSWLSADERECVAQETICRKKTAAEESNAECRVVRDV